MGYIDKAPASRILRGQVLGPWTGSGTLQSTNFGLGEGGQGVFHIRVISQIAGWVTINTTNATAISTSTFVPGVYLAANTANGDYFATRPGEVLTFTSTTTTSGVLISVAEMT